MLQLFYDDPGGEMSDINADILRRNLKKEEEQVLIDKAILGSEAAFAKLYNRYYSQMHSFCTRLLRGKFDVDDAVQQVFFEAWRSMARFEGRAMFSTWLTKIAIHTCLSFHRKAVRIVLSTNDEVGPYDNEAEQVWGVKNGIPEDDLILGEKRAMVQKLLDKMKDKKKAVFVLSDIKGLTAPEISKILKIPDATVRTRLFHARREFSLWVKRNPAYREILMR